MESRVNDDRGPVILGRYELLKRIAVGGMAEIYLAKESGIGFEKLCVVKLILPQLAQEPHLVRMFLDEARVAATLQHQNIVQMYDVGEVNSEYFISMEFLDGEDCRAIYKTMRRKQMKVPYEIALAIIIGAARGLHYAHEKIGFDGQPLHIVHRDVTPHNVFITYDGGIKLLDFGVAKAANRQNKTTAGTLKGKIPYMSPEQCRGTDLDRRSDIYALGILLYELTTGVRLYSSATDGEFETMRKIVEDAVDPPSAHREGFPAPLEAIALKCLEKDPARRFQTARDLQSALEDFVRSTKLPVSSITTARFMTEHFRDHMNVWKNAAGDETKLVNAIAAKLKESSGPGGEVDSGPGSDPSVPSATSGSGHTPSAAGEVLSNIPTGVDVPKPVSARNAPATAREGRPQAPTPVPVATPMAGSGATPVPGTAVASTEASPSYLRAVLHKRKWPVAMIGLFVLAVALGIVIGLTGKDDGDSKAAATSQVPEAGEGAGDSDDGADGEEANSAVGEAHDGEGSEDTEASAGGEPESGAAGTADSKPHASDDAQPGGDGEQPGGEGEQPGSDGEQPGSDGEQPGSDGEQPGSDGDGDEPDDADTPRNPDKTGKPEPKRRPPAYGELRVTSAPACKLYIDGKEYGSTPRVIRNLRAGKHKVRLHNPRFGIDKSYSVFIRANKITKKRYNFPVDD